MGSAIAPATAGPTIYPAPQEAPMNDKPMAWLLSSETSESTALEVETMPTCKIKQQLPQQVDTPEENAMHCEGPGRSFEEALK